MHFVGLKIQFCWTKNVRLNIRNVGLNFISSDYRIENAFCWTKLNFFRLNCILSDKVKIQTISA
jgi:hypothetical protein